MKKIFWKIRHKQTGLFYQTVKGRSRSWDATNLGPNGKAYNLKPTLKHISHGYSRLVPIKEDEKEFQWRKKKSVFCPFIEDEWEILEFFTVEKSYIEKLEDKNRLVLEIVKEWASLACVDRNRDKDSRLVKIMNILEDVK